jgi:hypothetical protein
LERLGDAALFEIDRASGIGLKLKRLAGWGLGGRVFESRRGAGPASVLPTKLTAEYNREPMSLYWYGRSAMSAEMPLLAFLAFYQVLEYYFPAYSPSKCVEKLREIAGDVQESDVDGVLKSIGFSKLRLFPEEKKQLMSTIGRCVDPTELNRFLADDEVRVEFYGSDESLDLSEHTIPVGSMRGDHRNKVAERIYQIRNRIVHTKSKHDMLDPLLPFDREAKSLEHDVALVRFLAQRVLVSSGWPVDSASMSL